MFQRNVGGVDRIVRLSVGVLALGAGLFLLEGGALRVGAIIVGLLGLVTGSVSFCPAYLPFRFSTRHNRA